MNKYRVAFADIDWESPMPGVRHKVVMDGGVKLRLVEYSKEVEPHWCTVGHVGQIIEGTIKIEFTDGTQIFEAGDGVMIPSGEKHRHRATVLSNVVRAIFVEGAL